MKSFITQLWFFLKDPLLEFLKTQSAKFIIKKCAKVVFMSVGFKEYIIAFVVEQLFDELAKPVIDLAFRKGGRFIEVKNGEFFIKKLNGAQTVTEWHTAIDNFMQPGSNNKKSD